MKKISILSILLIILMLLVGCDSITFSREDITTKNATTENTTKNTTTTKGLITISETAPLTKTSDGTTTILKTTTEVVDLKNLTMHDISSEGYFGWYYMNSIGEEKILVIPVVYEPYKDLATEDKLVDLNTAFFSETGSGEYESVKSYYWKSSYGKLSIDGTVLPYTRSFSKSELRNDEDSLISYTDSYLKENGINTKDYDSDGDGFIDFVAYIYFAPDSVNSEDVPEYFWAYTTYSYNDANKDCPTVNNYMFASYDFMYTSDMEGIDALTYIHETGHALGLDDYYDNTEDACDPVGSATMMSYNVGDLDAFSKFSLGWMENVISVTDSATITLHSLETIGECVIIGNNYDGNAFSEYILLEYYTPTNLNYYNSTKSHEDVILPDKSGIIIYHIDARLGMADYYDDIKVLKNYSSYKNDGNYTLTTMMASNTPEYSLYYDDYSRRQSSKVNYKLITLIDRQKTSHIDKEYPMSNSSLFVEGDTFDTSTISFNGEDGVSYKISFSDQTDSTIQLSIVRS